MKKLLTAILVATLPVASIALPAAAQLSSGMELGPKVGAKAPAFTLITSGGESQRLQDITGDKGVALVFVRSADWCPFCKLQLKNLNDVAAEMDTLGWPIVAASYDSQEIIATFAKANGLGYALLSDPGSKAIDAFGIRNETVSASARFSGIPHPIILFIAKDGTAQAKLYEEAYQKRPPGELVVSTAKGLK